MSFSSIIFAGLMVLQMISMNLLFTDYARDFVNKFEEDRLKIAVNYAVDAAVKEMRVSSANLGQDYESLSKLNVDPMVAMDTFATVIAKNYDVPVNSTNIQSMMLEYVPVFMVATYDGYYISSREEINTSGVKNVLFSPKLPYSEVYKDVDGNEFLYSYNLSLDSAIEVREDGSVYKVENPPLSKEEQSNLINSVITDVLNESLVKYANTDPRGKIFIPSELTTLHATNAIKNTSVFAYIDNFDLSGFGHDLQSFAIGGAEIKQKKVVVAFSLTHGGKEEKFYAYSDRVPDGAVLLETFDSQEDAAEHGYYFYNY